MNEVKVYRGQGVSVQFNAARCIHAAECVHGLRSRRVYRLGDRVRVRVLSVDAERRLMDLGLAEQIDAMLDGTPKRRRETVRPRRPASERRRRAPRQPPRGRTRRRR